jgi:hypothetical protein
MRYVKRNEKRGDWLGCGWRQAAENDRLPHKVMLIRWDPR